MSKKRAIWEIIKNILSVGFILSFAGNIIQYKSYNINKAKFEIDKALYEKSRKPDITIEYLTESSSLLFSYPRIRIANSGDARADSVWISEKIYLVSDSAIVYECDLPRFNYLFCEGSDNRMFDLGPGDDTIFTFIPPSFSSFSSVLLKNYKGQLASKWRVDYFNAQNGKRDMQESYILITDGHLPISPHNFAGSRGFIDAVVRYERYGPARYLHYENTTDRYYDVLPPNDYYIDDKGKLQFRYPGDKHKYHYVQLEAKLDNRIIARNPTIYEEWRREEANNGVKFPPRGAFNFIVSNNNKDTLQMFQLIWMHLSPQKE